MSYSMADCERIYEIMKDKCGGMYTIYESQHKEKVVNDIFSTLNNNGQFSGCTYRPDRIKLHKAGLLKSACGNCFECGTTMVEWYAKEYKSLLGYWQVQS